MRVGIDFHEAQPCMCGAVMRPCGLLVMDSGGEDAVRIAKGRPGPQQAASRIPLGRVAHPGAFVALLRMRLSAGRSGLNSICVPRPCSALRQKAPRAQKGSEL